METYDEDDDTPAILYTNLIHIHPFYWLLCPTTGCFKNAQSVEPPKLIFGDFWYYGSMEGSVSILYFPCCCCYFVVASEFFSLTLSFFPSWYHWTNRYR